MKNRKKLEIKSNILMWFILGFICFTSVMIIWAKSDLINADTAWHITLGEWILKNKKVPTTDIFSQSYVLDGKTLTFLSHQWLTDIIFSIIHKIGKMNLLYYFMVAVIFVEHLFVVKFSGKENRIVAALMLLAFSFVGFHKELWITPDTIAVLGLVGLNLLIVNWIKQEEKERKKNFLKIAIINGLCTILLGNIHGGMLSANLIVQAVTMLGFIVLGSKKEFKVSLIHSLTLLTSTFVCGLINPHTIKIYGYGYMNNSTAAEYLADWETFKFDNSIQIVIVGIVALLSVIGIVIQLNKNERKRQIKIDILLLCMYAGMLFRYQRTLNVFTLAMALYMSKYVRVAFERLFATINIKRLDIVKRIAAIVLIIVSVVTNFSVLSNKPEKNKTIQECAYSYISPEMVDYIKTEEGQIRIFNTIECGGYLICLGIAPYIDGRTDPYLAEYGNQDLFTRSIKAVHSISVMDNITKAEGIDCLVLRKNAISSQIMYASDKWEVKYESDAAVMFTRVTE